MDKREFLKSLKITEKNEQLALKISEQNGLSQQEIEFGKLLLNEKLNEFGYYYIKKDKEFYHIAASALSEKEYEKYINLYAFLFGKENTEVILSCLDRVKHAMYQSSYGRFSYRAPYDAETALHSRIRFLVKIINYVNMQIPVEEYFRFNIGYDKNFSLYISELAKSNDWLLGKLIDGVYGRHEYITISGELVRTLMNTNDPKAFKAVEDLLLSAQRQEGLRQTILECLDETTIEAQVYFMKVILDNNLIRFSSVKRALFCWCGIVYEAEREQTAKRFMELGYRYLSNHDMIQEGIASSDNAECYMALWAKGCIDVVGTLEDVQNLFINGSRHKKLIAMEFAYNTRIRSICASLGKAAITSKDIAIFAKAIQLVKMAVDGEKIWGIEQKNGNMLDYFSIEELIAAFENAMYHLSNMKQIKITADVNIFEFAEDIIERSEISSFMYKMARYDDELLNQMIDIFESLDADTRLSIAMFSLGTIGRGSEINSSLQKLIFMCIQDKRPTVREYGFQAIEYVKLDKNQIIEVENLLKTNSSQYRKQIINTILNAEISQIKSSVKRLLDRKSVNYNLGALDILNQMKSEKIESEWVKQKALYYKENIETDSQAEILLKNILSGEESVLEYTPENGFGLYDINYTKDYSSIDFIEENVLDNVHLSALEVTYVNEQIARLQELLEKHQSYEYESEINGIKQNFILGNNFASKSAAGRILSGEELFATYPLAEVWREWYIKSGLTPRQVFLTRLYIKMDMVHNPFSFYRENKSKAYDILHNLSVYGMKKIDIKDSEYKRVSRIISEILEALLKIYPYGKKDEIEFYHLQLQNAASYFDKSIFEELRKPSGFSRGGLGAFVESCFMQLSLEYLALVPDMDKQQLRDCIFIYSYISRTESGLSQKPGISLNGYGLNADILCRGFEAGAISEDEFIENLLVPKMQSEISDVRYRRQEKYFVKYPFLLRYMDRISQRLLDIETARGDAATNASYITCKLGYVRGMENYAKILNALGTSGLHSGSMWMGANADSSKKEMLSFLLRQAKPREGEDSETFKKIIDKYKISRTKLIESAVYNPVWVPFVKEYLGIEYFESAVWWIYAHTNGACNVENISEISRYSKIELADFRNGAVDVDWFKDAYSKIDCWDEIYKCGKYVTEGNGHTRAQLFADAILKKVSIEDAMDKVEKTRNKDYLRIVGLIPLGKDKKKELLKRYNFIQKFAKEAKQFGAQRQISEKIAVQIAIDNLARTGGYSDTMRLIWNMETENTIDILSRSQDVKIGDIYVSIVVEENGKSNIEVKKDGKPQKTIPAKFKNNEQINEMKEFVKELNEQGKRVSKSMEEAMINMDYFEADEIERLMKNPIIRPVLEKLVIKAGDDLGFYIDGEIVGVKQRKIKNGEKVYIAHCYDLYKSGSWGYFQEKCFKEKIKQPFKQAFRELYIPTEEELREKNFSRRYAGYQVSVKKAFALLKSRGWQVNYEEGLLKYFKKQNIIVNLLARANWFTPADIEAPTLEAVQFLGADEGKIIDFKNIEPTIFSETMRDIDLVVSVAYVGGVDPEVSHSTIEMRRALVKETAKLFKIENYQMKDNHVIINGHYGNYSVHLGSGVVHKILGAHLDIVPVHSAQRGRLFLPFMDNDPMSAEILSKVLLLCRDKEIKDPTILRQVE